MHLSSTFRGCPLHCPGRAVQGCGVDRSRLSTRAAAFSRNGSHHGAHFVEQVSPASVHSQPLPQGIGSYQLEAWTSAARPIEEAYLPPASWYIDQGAYEVELKKVFMKNWMYVGGISQIPNPGDYFTSSLFGINFIVSRDDRGDVRAFHNVCSHRAARVMAGEGNAQEFRCPYHAWTFDLQGRFRGCGLKDTMNGIKNFTAQDNTLTPIRVDTWGSLIYLNFSNSSELAPMEEYLGGADPQWEEEGLKQEDWVFYKRLSYPMACNWKVMVDNYQDGNYHVWENHPDLALSYSMTPGASHNKIFERGTCMWGDNMNPEDDTRSQFADKKSLQMLIESRETGGTDQAYSHQYPNFFFNRYGCWFSTTRVNPTGPGTCVTDFDLYFKRETLRDQAFVDMCERVEDDLQHEDMALCFAVQENLYNPVYGTGRYAPVETPMWYHHQLLHRDLFGTAPGLDAPSTTLKDNAVRQYLTDLKPAATLRDTASAAA